MLYFILSLYSMFFSSLHEQEGTQDTTTALKTPSPCTWWKHWTIKRCSFTWTLNKGPVIGALHRTHADVEHRLQAVFPWRGRGGHLDRAPVGALDALPLAGVAGIRAPPAARLLQALSARAVPRAVFSYKKPNQNTKLWNESLSQTQGTKKCRMCSA